MGNAGDSRGSFAQERQGVWDCGRAKRMSCDCFRRFGSSFPRRTRERRRSFPVRFPLVSLRFLFHSYRRGNRKQTSGRDRGRSIAVGDNVPAQPSTQWSQQPPPRHFDDFERLRELLERQSHSVTNANAETSHTRRAAALRGIPQICVFREIAVAMHNRMLRWNRVNGCASGRKSTCCGA